MMQPTNIPSMRIPAGEYALLEHKFPDLLPPVPRIVDPVNPTNNIYLTGIAATDDTREHRLRWKCFADSIASIDLRKDVNVIMAK